MKFILRAIFILFRMLQRRIDKALAKRKLVKDPFRNENGYSWDYVIVFKVYTVSDELTEAQKMPSRTVKGIVDSLAASGIQTKLFYSIQVFIYYF